MKLLRTFDNNQILWDEILWRYCTVDRLESIIKTNKVYFASANQFSDPFEGAVAVQVDVPPPDPRYADMEVGEHAFFELKRLTKISCWHRAEYESDAMWKLYAGEAKGVTICSTPTRIKNSFIPFRLQPNYGVEEMWGGPVQYVDLTQIRMRKGMLDRFFFKHRAFEWEKEFRLAISLRTAEEFGVPVPENGIEVDVNLNELIDHIIVGPQITAPERARVQSLVNTAGLNDKLRFSSLLGTPRFI